MLTKGKRANNIIMGTKAEQLKWIRNDIVEFKTAKKLDQVIVLWTANTERFSEIITGVNDTADNLLKAIKENHLEISPSTMFAVAAALEGVRFNFKIIFFFYDFNIFLSYTLANNASHLTILLFVKKCVCSVLTSTDRHKTLLSQALLS